MSEEEPRRPKLIMPDPESARPKSQLLVPGEEGELSPAPVMPEVEAAVEGVVEAVEDATVAASGMTVINEETGEQSVTSATGPVKIQEMAPPPLAETVEEVAHEAVAEVEQVAEVVYEEVAPAAEVVYEQPAAEEVVYEQPAAEVAYEQPAEVYQEPVYDPAQAAAPQEAYYPPEAYAQQPAYTPPPPAAAVAPAYQAPPQAYGQPPVQQAPMGVYPGATMPMMVGQPKGVPGWALFFLGLLGGFLITLALFKFTALADGLRPDLIERGRDQIKRQYGLQDSDDEESADEAEEEEVDPEEPNDQPAPTAPPEEEVERDASGQPADPNRPVDGDADDGDADDGDADDGDADDAMEE